MKISWKQNNVRFPINNCRLAAGLRSGWFITQKEQECGKRGLMKLMKLYEINGRVKYPIMRLRFIYTKHFQNNKQRAVQVIRLCE